MLTEKEPKQIPPRCGKKQLTKVEPKTNFPPDAATIDKQNIPTNPAMVVEQQIQNKCSHRKNI